MVSIIFTSTNTCFTVFAMWVRQQKMPMPKWIEVFFIWGLGKIFIVNCTLCAPIKKNEKLSIAQKTQLYKKYFLAKEIHSKRAENGDVFSAKTIPKEHEKYVDSENGTEISFQIDNSPTEKCNRVCNVLEVIKDCLEYLATDGLSENESAAIRAKWITLEKVLTRFMACVYTISIIFLCISYIAFINS